MEPVTLLLVGFLKLLYFAQLVNSHSNGIFKVEELNALICPSMTPVHGVEPMTTDCPYTIQLSNTAIQPLGMINVTIGAGPSGERFKGFLAMGAEAKYKENVKFTSKGEMDKIPPDGPKVEFNYIVCDGGGIGIAHAHNSNKHKVKFGWIAPREEGDYVVLVTFVKDYKTFWTKQPSPVIRVCPPKGCDKNGGAQVVQPAGGDKNGTSQIVRNGVIMVICTWIALTYSIFR